MAALMLVDGELPIRVECNVVAVDVVRPVAIKYLKENSSNY